MPLTKETGVRTDRRVQILDTAAESFVTHGYVETSMRELAQLLGIKAASLYYHFTSKEALLLEVCRAGIASLLEYLEALLVQSPPREHLIRTLFESHVAMLRYRGNYLGVYMRHRHYLPPAALQELNEPYEAYRQRIDICIRRVLGLDSNENQSTLVKNGHQILIAILKQLNDIYFGNPDYDLDRMCKDAARIISTGMIQG